MSNPGLDPWAVAAQTSGAEEPQADWSPSSDEAREAILGFHPQATITSMYRTPEKNRAVGGVAGSLHLQDEAADVVLPKGVTAKQFRSHLENQGYPIGQFIDEGDHVHWAWGSKDGKTGRVAADPWGAAPAKADDPWAAKTSFTEAELLAAAQKPKWTNTPAERAALDDYLVANRAMGGRGTTGIEPEAPKKAESSWWDVLVAKPIENFPATLKQFAGSLAQMVGEAPLSFEMPEEVGVRAMGRNLAGPKARAAEEESNRRIAASGRALYETALADIQANAPQVNEGSAKDYAYRTSSAVMQTLPVILGAAVTRSPAVGAILMGDQAVIQKYGQARVEQARPVAAAQMDAYFSGLLNGGLGAVPLGVLMTPGKTFLGKTLAGTAAMGASEVATEALQVGYDKGLVTPDMTFEQAWARVQDAGIVGTMMGLFFAGGHAGLESGARLYHAKVTVPKAEEAGRVDDYIRNRAREYAGIPNRRAQAPVTPEVVPDADMPPPQGRPAPPRTGAPLQAQARLAMGLDRPGTAPPPDPWAPTHEPGTPPPGYEAPSPAGEALNREFPRVPPAAGPDTSLTNLRPPPPPKPAGAPEAQQVEGGGIARRTLEPDVAITSTGREVPVHYAVVEARDLIPSQTQEGNVNPAFPGELQPRDRTRAVSQAQVASIAQNINPRLLDRSVNASDGAPIVAPSGVVESGNGRTLAIQRAYVEGMPSARAYREYLESKGYPVEGMEMPVLVRVRTDAMPIADRQAFVREANQAGQLGYSATERAMTDAAALPGHALELFRGGDIESAANRPFVRAFMGNSVGANEHATMVDQNGNLSLEGGRRVRAALLAKAYADPDLVGSVVENADTNIKAIGNALTDSAPGWAMMREAAAKGEIPQSLDQTPKLLQAVQMVARARADGRHVAELVNQKDIFTGQAVDPDVEGWLRLMFRNTKDWTQPVGREKLAEALQFYASEAQKAQAGDNLLGEAPVTPGEVLSIAKAKQYAGEPSGSGPSLSFGEDPGIRGEQGDRSGDEGPEAGRSPGDAAAGPEGAGEGVRPGPFGPEPRFTDFQRVHIGQKLNLSGEATEYAYRSGADPNAVPREETVAALSNWVLARGKKFGYESLAVIDRSGAIGAATNGDARAVSFSKEILATLMDPQERAVTVHNHPSNSAFSAGDIGTLAYPGHRGMVVVGHDGEWHAVELVATLHGADINAMAGMLKGAQAGARKLATDYVDNLYNLKQVNGNEGDHMLSAIQMLAMERAGVIRYMGPDRIPERYRQEVQHVVNRIAAGIRLFFEQKADQGVRVAPRGPEIVNRSAQPVQLAHGIEEILGGTGPDAARAGSGSGAPAGARRPEVYRKPEQLRLLEEENHYEQDRPPFYSALTRSIEESKLSRAPAKDWLGLIENLKTKGVKQEEIDWSGVKDWLTSKTGPVTRDEVLQHLRENEVQVQEVEKGTGPAVEQQRALATAEDNWVSYMLGQGFTERDARDFGLDAARGNLSEGQKRNMSPEELRLAEEYRRAYEARKPGAQGQITKFDSYTLPGGENYREMLLTLPERDKPIDTAGWTLREAPKGALGETEIVDPAGVVRGYTEDQVSEDGEVIRRFLENQRKRGGPDFRSGHWDEPNVLAHIRFDDRTGPNGEKVLHIAEVQSDWHQQGRRRGYTPREAEQMQARRREIEALGRDATQEQRQEWADIMNRLRPDTRDVEGSTGYKGVPDAPFKTSWPELAMKRVLRYAAEHGYDRVSWDNGDTQAARYDLSKQVDYLLYKKNPDGTYQVSAQSQGRGHLLGDKITEAGLEAHIGKDVAKRIVEGAGSDENLGGHGTTSQPKDIWKKLSGDNLKVGGEGMRGFYDRILPAAVSKLAKKWGAKVEASEVGANQTTLVYKGRSIGRNPTKDQIQAVSDAIHAPPTDQQFISPVTGARVEYQINRAANEMAFRDVVKEMERGKSFHDAMEAHGTRDLADIFGGDMVQAEVPGGEKVHSIAITPAMRESVMQGQPLFEEGRRYGEIPRDDRETLERAARTGNWIGKYGAGGETPDGKIRAAIGAAYRAWQRSPLSLPMGVRKVFQDIPELPGGFSDVPTTRPTEAFSAKVKRTADSVMDLVHDAQMLIAPMAEGTPQSRAVAKDFANMMRLARWHGSRMIEGLKKNFDPHQLRRMWEAADEESVLRQQGQPTAGKGLSTLTPDERRAVLAQQADAQAVWQAAKDQGMVEGEGLPSFVPRMMVEMASTGVRPLGEGDGGRSIPGIGRNLKTQTGQMKHRKYLTAQETEGAASAKFGTLANVVKDIRTLPLATMKLREAVAGRALINKIKEIGEKTGDETVVEGHEPAGTPYKWFTLNHPAFKTWRPKIVKNEETGKYEPAKDQNGDIIFEKVPLYVREDFEGPLRAVLSLDSGKVYTAAMNLKGRAMSAIMYSPIIHNAVEWGRALPAMPGKVATFKIYFEGNRAKRDTETMTQAILHGLVPIGHQASFQDLTSLAAPDSIKAGRSWTAKVLGAIPGLFSRDAKEAVYRAVDRMGDFWHNTLLWDRVGDLQMGLYTNFRDSLVKKGYTPDAAAYTAAHFANRYAGALPLESMSTMSRKIANLVMFSRTYTLGNLGAMKDVVTGLPRDVKAQIERDGGMKELKGVKSMAARKALSILAVDIALFYAMNSILQSSVAYLSGRQDLDEIEKGYVDRLSESLRRVKDDPRELANPFKLADELAATSENEPGRENRILIGYENDGTAIYARNPVGKIGEEFKDWLESPLETGKKKMSTFARPTYAVITNDAGFGRKVYDPDAKGLSGMASNLGKIVSLYFESQIPIDSLKSTITMLKGEGRKVDTYKALGPMAGVTFSKGAPGGPGVGEMFELRDRIEAERSAAMPAIIQKIRGGDIQGARTDMRQLGISPGLQNYYVRVTQNPRLRLNTKAARELLRQATPEERARILQPAGGQ